MEIFDYNTFLKGFTEPPSCYGFMVFLVEKNKPYKYFCFVEGTTDVTFYSNLNTKTILANNIEYIPMLNVDRHNISELDIGKAGVIRSYIFIKEKLKRYLDKCIFIVDHDYQGLLNSKIDVTNRLSEYNNNITITDMYSFENYFFSNDNLMKIFKEFNLLEQHDKFIKKFKEFIKDIVPYNRLKSSIIITYVKGTKYTPKVNYKRVNDPNTIFHFNFKGKYKDYLNRKELDEENRVMAKAISNNKNATEYYNKESVKFNDYMFMRGHDLYKFMQYYFYEMFNIDIRPNMQSEYLRLVKVIDVNLSIKNGNVVD